jgi:hypothetical protein
MRVLAGWKGSGPLVLAFLLLSGCSPAKVVVAGKVSYQGRPVTTGEVHFIGEGGRSRSGLIGPEGAYQVDDVPAGPVTVTIVATKLTGGAEEALPSPVGVGEPGPPPRLVVVPLVPPKYGAPETSGLKYTIERGRQTIDFDLQD